ncbi:hypothetical protein [Paenibacillus sp. S150]|uniref:hypothetical protein n=1 Tax=Paenibacillus sp. S150 TaxID=2749826 RepID=UPI001C593826|nr:hypothetical protein [Paenibacillus sp. S150]MBW4083825.1 hypothetical protein [Paenibacillus sp. S150]
MDDYSPPQKDPSSSHSHGSSPDWGMPPGQQTLYGDSKRDLKHSGPGIASFVIAMITVAGYIIAFVFVGVRSSSVVSGSDSFIADYAEAIFYLGMSVLILAAVNVIGAVTGIIGLTLRRRRKVFAIIGTIINGVILLLFMLLIATVLVNAGSA